MSSCGCGCSCNSGGGYSRILRGPAGEAGKAATITIGNVTTGEEARITNVGTETNAVLDFVLPIGKLEAKLFGIQTQVNGTSELVTALQVSSDGGTSWEDASANGALSLTFDGPVSVTDNGKSGSKRNVTLKFDVSKLTGVVRTVNGKAPQENGDILLDIPTITDDTTSEAKAADLTVPSCYMVKQLIEQLLKDSHKTIAFPTASQIWTITNPFKYRPAVTVVDTDGMQVEAHVQYPTDSQIVITFNTPTKGYAYLS